MTSKFEAPEDRSCIFLWKSHKSQFDQNLLDPLMLMKVIKYMKVLVEIHHECCSFGASNFEVYEFEKVFYLLVFYPSFRT